MDGEISVSELATLQASDETVRVVDIRTKREFDRARIPDSESIPFAELTTRITELEGSERIVTACPHGISSQQAAQLIASYTGTQDARVESLRGGLEAWEREEGLECPDPVGNAGGESTADEGPSAPF